MQKSLTKLERQIDKAEEKLKKLIREAYTEVVLDLMPMQIFESSHIFPKKSHIIALVNAKINKQNSIIIARLINNIVDDYYLC